MSDLAILGFTLLPGCERGTEITQFVIDILRLLDRLGDLLAEQLTVALTHLMQEPLDRRRLDPEPARERLVGYIFPLGRE